MSALQSTGGRQQNDCQIMKILLECRAIIDDSFQCILEMHLDGAIALNQPLDMIYTVMAFRSLYHFFRAVLRGESDDVVSYLTKHYKLFGLVKYRRKRHREIDVYTQQIWANPL